MRIRKKLAILISAIFISNSISFPVVPLAQAANSTDVSSAAEEIQKINSIEDDVEFIKAVGKLIEDKSGKTNPADNYEELVKSAQEATTAAVSQGKEADSLSTAILETDKRVKAIEKEVAGNRKIDASKINDVVVKEAQEVYEEGRKEVETCKKNAKDDEEKGKCALSDKARNAADVLFSEGLKQINQGAETTETKNSLDMPNCPSGTVSAGNGKCCAEGTPNYDSVQDRCYANGAITKNSTNSESKLNKLMDALSEIGFLATIFPQKGTSSTQERNHDDGKVAGEKTVGKSQFSFNYLMRDKKENVYYFPQNSADDITFRLHYSGLSLGEEASSPKARLYIELPLSKDGGKTVSTHVAEIDIPINKKITVIPKNLKGSQYFKGLADYGELVRVPASEAGKKHYTMRIAVIDQNNRANRTAFQIEYDFTGAKSMISKNPNKELDIATEEVEADISKDIHVIGKIDSTEWKNGICTLKVAGRIVSDNAAQDGTVSIDSEGRFTRQGCEGAGKAAGSSITFKGLYSLNGGGNLIDDVMSSDMNFNVQDVAGNWFSDSYMDTFPKEPLPVTVTFKGCGKGGKAMQISVDISRYSTDPSYAETLTRETNDLCAASFAENNLKPYKKIDRCNDVAGYVCAVREDENGKEKKEIVSDYLGFNTLHAFMAGGNTTEKQQSGVTIPTGIVDTVNDTMVAGSGDGSIIDKAKSLSASLSPVEIS